VKQYDVVLELKIVKK